MNGYQEEIMRRFKGDIEYLLPNNSILALDIFYVHDFNEYTSKSYSLFCNNYIDNILIPFLSDFGTLGASNSYKKESRNYAGSIKKTIKSKFNFKEINEIVNNNKTGTFNEIVSFLKLKGFGQYAYWNNSFIEYENKKLNISIFFILENQIEEYFISKIDSLILKYLIPEINKIILSESVSLAKELLILQKRADYLQKLNSEFNSHIHVLNMFDPLDNIEEAIKETNSIQNTNLQNILSGAYLSAFFRNIYIGIINQKGKHFEFVNTLTSVNKILNLIEDKRDIFFVSKNIINVKLTYEGVNDYEINNDSVIDLMTIILNFWSNAVKHSSDGKCEIVVHNKSFEEYSIDFINSGEIKNELVEFVMNKENSSLCDMCFGLSEIRTKIENYPIHIELISIKNPVNFRLKFIK